MGLWHSAEEKLTKCQVRREVGSGHAASGKASRAKRGGVEKNGVAFATANASRFFERSR